MSTVLSFATYPTAFPRQGGQKRIAAFRSAYDRLGISLISASIVERPPYAAAECGPFDLLHAPTTTPFGGLPHLGDLRSGVFAANDVLAFAHFQSVIARIKPAAIQLEQPFLWPLIARLRRDPLIAALPLIYASQNWEAPLKAAILADSGVMPEDAAAIAAEIETLERSVAAAADLVIAVSTADAVRYRPLLKPQANLLVVPNGADEALDAPQPDPALMGRRYAVVVGSDYPPNVDGAAALIYGPGLWFMPPEPSLAVCGAMAFGVFGTDAYQDFSGAHDARTHFFPAPSDAELAGLLAHAHMILLPIRFGGGSNLKTAEALASNCHVVATPTALRGFEAFAGTSGVHIGSDPAGFHAAMVAAWNLPKLTLSAADRAARDTLHWGRCIPAGALKDALAAIGLQGAPIAASYPDS